MILHVDMDAFYASVEERDDPSLVGKPVIVGGSAEGRGVVCAANYEARKYGVHSAMAAARAVRLCPNAIFLKPRMNYYAAISRQIHEVFGRFSPIIEPLSLDEAFIDVTHSAALFGGAASIAAQIKRQIRDELGLIASVGVAPSKFIAKIASDLKKPDGLVVVQPDEVQAFLDPLPVGRIWGVGKVTGKAFAIHGIQTIGQLRRLDIETLTSWFGSSGEHYWQLANGIDKRSVIPDREAKSISHETTFAHDITDRELLRAWLVELVEQVARRARRHHLRARVAELKLRFHDFRTLNRSATLPEATNTTGELLPAAFRLLDAARTSGAPVRLLGFGLSGFRGEADRQLSLFDVADQQRERKLDEIADRIADRFGKQAVRRAAGQRNVEQ